MDSAKYHGQDEDFDGPAKNVPPMPADAKRHPIAQGTGTYAQVTMIGHYGLACSGNRTKRFSNISLAQARQLKWDWFGVCGAQMTCFDAHGNVVHEE